ncbi:MAG: Maf family protein [Dehalococcoidia bacterium]|nr:Maf family protein [Dehalococcoidia bacterium]
MPSPHIVLASASPRRRELLAALGLAFEVRPSEVDEGIEDADPVRVAETLALRKARAVTEQAPDALVIGSDTVVALDGVLLGKPASAEEARVTLRTLRGRRHEVVTGVAVALGAREAVGHGRTAVLMRDYGDEEIEAFIASGGPFDKAGAYAIQDAAFAPVAAFEGCHCNVVGLPLGELRRLLATFGIETEAPSVDCPVCAPETEPAP